MLCCVQATAAALVSGLKKIARSTIQALQDPVVYSPAGRAMGHGGTWGAGVVLYQRMMVLHGVHMVRRASV